MKELSYIFIPSVQNAYLETGETNPILSNDSFSNRVRFHLDKIYAKGMKT